jgi:hypothetical protein
MKNPLLSLILGALCLLALPTMAEEQPNKAIEDALKTVAPGITPSSIKPSKIAGFFEITAGAKVFYMTADGKYLLQGKLTDVKTDKRPTAVPGLDEFISGSKLYYVSDDGNYFLEGSLIDIKAGKDLTEARLG